MEPSANAGGNPGADDLRDRLQTLLSGTHTFERELSGGGMSRAFLAPETSLGRRVVVKVLPLELAGGVSAERFRREIRLSASLQQANIVPVHSAGEVDGLPYYTMPFVEGESLRARLTVTARYRCAKLVGCCVTSRRHSSQGRTIERDRRRMQASGWTRSRRSSSVCPASAT